MGIIKYFIILLFLLFFCCTQEEINKPKMSSATKPPRSILRIAIINPCKNPDKLSMVKPVADILANEKNIIVKTFHYREQEQFLNFKADAVIITGQSTPWEEYNLNDFLYIKKYISNGDKNYLGICGGHQLIVLLYGGSVDLIKHKSCNKKKGYRGCFKIRGFISVTLLNEDPIFSGYTSKENLFASHCEEVKQLPQQFTVIASTKISAIYAIKHKELPLYGVQFHPELPANNNLHGKRIIQNFLTISRKQLSSN